MITALRLWKTTVAIRNKPGFILNVRKYVTTDPGKQLTPEEHLKRKDEAAKLAMQSIKDIGNMFSLTQSDKETLPIDTAPIFEDPELFASLSLLHQGQVLNELQEKYDKKWNLLTQQEKRLGYYISYGNWGVREKFNNWNANVTPYDLPFETPSLIRISVPKANDKINILPERDYRLTSIRKDQFDIKRLDGVTKSFIYIMLLVVVMALYRDKFIGEDGRPVELIIRDIHEENRQQKLEQERLQQENQQHINNSKKWYYLWLK